MQLSARLAGICGSAAFIITALPGFYQQAKPTNISQMSTATIPGINIIETMLISLGFAIGAGIIGHMMGDILSHPKGNRKKKQAKQAAKSAALLAASPPAPKAIAETSAVEAETPAAQPESPSVQEGELAP